MAMSRVIAFSLLEFRGNLGVSNRYLGVVVDGWALKLVEQMTPVGKVCRRSTEITGALNTSCFSNTSPVKRKVLRVQLSYYERLKEIILYFL